MITDHDAKDDLAPDWRSTQRGEETRNCRVQRQAEPISTDSTSPRPEDDGGTTPIQTIQLFEERWPACFSVSERRRRPLKVGIHVEVIAALAGQVSEADVRAALALYVKNARYLKKLKTGKPRVGLDGLPAGTVTKGEEWHAKLEISRRATDKPEPDKDPDGSWARRLHPANADKPRLSLRRRS
jgi:sRNA-binding protein